MEMESGSGEGIGSYRDLRVWQDAMTIAPDCYALTSGFPREEAFGMTAQIRRSAVSIAANIAEGHGRENTGSIIARCEGLGRQLRALIRSLQRRAERERSR
jgi:hypothetical protein